MNKLFDKIKFIIRLSFKNIIYSKFRAIILLMTFTILIFLSILTFSTKTFLTQYFYREKIETYQDIDFYLTYDQNSNARYFSIRELANKMDIEKEFKYIVPFFQMNSIMEINNNTLNYVNILATSLEDFKKVTNISNSYTQLNQNEILITSTIGKKYTILTGDTIYLKLGGEEVPFKVIDVIDDNGLFRDNNVFIDKDSNIKYFLKSFGMEDLNPIFTKNIYNRVYFSLNDDSKKEEIKKEILDIPQYKNYLLIDTINNELIEESVTKVASILFLVFTFILLSVVLVLQSTLLIIFEERKPQIGVTQILGGRRGFSAGVIISEIFTYIFIAFILGLIMSHVIFNGGLRYMGSTLKYRNSTDHLIMSIGFVLGILSIIIFYNYLKITKTSLIELSIASKVVKANPPILSAISLIVCLISYLFNNYFFSDWNSREFVSLINIITSLVFMFSVSRVLLVLIKLMVERKKKTLFSIFSVKNFNDHKIMNPMINILLTSFILIILLVGTNDYMSYRTNELKEIVNIDFGITNIVNNIDSTYASLKDDEKVSHVDLGYYYTNVKVDELDTYFWFSISLDANQIQQYLNIDIETSLLEKLKNESIPYVILPIKFHYLNKLEVGDTVHININKQYENQPFVVGGFIDMGINEIMITNINYLDQYQDLNPNTILINTHDFNNIKKQDLIERYDQEMYYIIDYQEMIDNQIEKFTKLTQYISYIILVLVLSFMLTIFNNLALEFTKMEPTFSRLRVLGCSIKKLIITILLEKLVILFAIIVSVLSVLRVIMNNLSHFLIYYGTYEKIRFTFYSVIMAIMIGAFMYLVSVAFYLSKIRKIKIAEVLKNF